MLVIEDVRLREYPDESEEVILHPRCTLEFWASAPEEKIPSSVPYEYEVIKTKQFVDHEGHRHRIGMSRDVQQAIGLPFAVFDSMNLYMETLRHEVNVQDRKLKQFQKAGFWQRFRYLLTGRMS